MIFTPLTPIKQGTRRPGCYGDFSRVLLDGETLISADVTCSIASMLESDSVEFMGTIVSWITVCAEESGTACFTVVGEGDKGSIVKGGISIKIE